MKLNMIVYIAVCLAVFSSCHAIKGKKGAKSSTTGWAYNSPKNGGFEYKSGYHQNAGPGLVYIQGGTFTMGRVEQDVMYDNNNLPRRVTVASFYMDETEVRNVDWREYLYWLRRVYPNDYQVYKEALPDTLVWRDELSYNEPYLENYLRHAAYSEYPVVGVSWVQADKYCKWRTDRVNENILVENKKLENDVTLQNEKTFSTDTYMNGMYEGPAGSKPIKSLSKDGGTRPVNMSDGLILPRYRLPTQAEWEYAALGLIGVTDEEVVSDRRIYPWSGNQIRNASKKNRGEMMANGVRGRGDYMGTAGYLNDKFEITAPVKSFEPNDYGLYCMAGNVNEWVQDIYRPGSSYDVKEFQPLRGNVYTNYRKDQSGKLIKNKYGDLVRDTVANFTNYKDGDLQSQIQETEEWVNDSVSSGINKMYTSTVGNAAPRISDHSRIYKGGSWKDRPYWFSPGTMRYMDERKSTNDIGFRCAMTHLGASSTK
jgi:gliding motility-associated lipoprotein GldJ